MTDWLVAGGSDMIPPLRVMPALVAATSPRPTLDRGLTALDATAVVVGNAIGAGIFMVPQVMTAAVPRPSAVFLAWIVAGLLTLCGALTFAELGAALPRSGGVYAFLADTIHPLPGFLFGWSLFWVINSGAIASIAVTFARYCSTLVPLTPAAEQVLAVLVILSLSVLNFLGVRRAGRLQTVVTATKIAAIVAVAAVAFTSSGLAESGIGAASVRLSEFGVAVAAALFAFGGWHTVTFNAEEVRRPERSIPIALVAGTLVIMGTYIAVNAAYLHVLPVEAVARSQHVASDVAVAVLGRAGASAIAGLVMISTFGAANGLLLAGPRVYYAMALDGRLPGPLAGVDARFRTPHVAILAQGVWASVLAATGTYEKLLTRVVFTEWGFFALAAIGLIRLRRLGPRGSSADLRPPLADPRQSSPDDVRGRIYHVWGYPFVPLLFAVVSAAVVVNTLVQRPGSGLFGIAVLAAGVPVYLWQSNRRERTR